MTTTPSGFEPHPFHPGGPAEGAALARLRDDVLEHLWKRFPTHCVLLTDRRCLSAIDVGIARAARHGFYRSSEVRPYVIAMVFLGSHFDEDPQLPWAGNRLRRSIRAPRRHAIADLLAVASKQMEPIVGRHGEYYGRALAWIGGRSFEALEDTYAADDDGLRLFLRHLYRRKHDALGPDGVTRLRHDARAMARRHGLTTPSGIVVVLGLMLLLGSGIDRDPFHPWVAEILSSSPPRGPDQRARELHARALETMARLARLDALSRRPLERN